MSRYCHEGVTLARKYIRVMIAFSYEPRGETNIGAGERRIDSSDPRESGDIEVDALGNLYRIDPTSHRIIPLTNVTAMIVRAR